MELRNWTDEPRGPDGKWGGGGHVAKTAAEAKWIAEGEAAWAKHKWAKENGKPSLATYYKKKASAAHAKLHGASSPEDVFKSKGASAPAPKHEDAIDAIHASLIQKHEEAKAAKKGSLATYYKKKAAAYKDAHTSSSPEAPKVASTHEDVAGTASASKAPEPVKAPEPPKADDGVPKTAAGLTPISGPHGSMPGTWYQDPKTGKSYYFKASKDAPNEVASAKVYEAIGLKPGEDLPRTGISENGKVVSEKLEGLQKSGPAIWSGRSWAHSDQAKKMFAAAVLTSHYDAAGSAQDNTLWNPSTGKAAIVDLGGAMGRRAQGGLKPSWTEGKSLKEEVDSISGGGPYANSNLKALFGKMTPAEKADALEDAKKALMSPGTMTKLQDDFKSLGMPLEQRNKAISVLMSRLNQVGPVADELRKTPAAPKPSNESGLFGAAKTPFKADAFKDLPSTAPTPKTDTPVVADLKTKYANAKGSLKNYYKKKLQAAGAWDDSLSSYKPSSAPKATKVDDAITADLKAKIAETSSPVMKKVYEKQLKEHTSGYKTDHGGTVPAVSKPTSKFMGHHIPSNSETAKTAHEFVNSHLHETHTAASEGSNGLNGTAIDVHKTVSETSKSMSAIRSYTGSKYRETNDALRGNSPMTAAVANRVKGIDEAFSAAPETDHAIQLWRHTGGPNTFDGLKPGDIMSDAGVQSTTTTRSAFGGGSHRTTIKITLPTGSKALWVKPVSRVPSENEVILPRGQKYVVTKAAYDDTLMGHPRRVIEVMAIPDSAVPGVNTHAAPADRPYQHNLRMKLLRRLVEARRLKKDSE